VWMVKLSGNGDEEEDDVPLDEDKVQRARVEGRTDRMVMRTDDDDGGDYDDGGRFF